MCSSLDVSGLNGGLVLTPLLVSQHVEEDTQGTHQTAGLLTKEVGSSATTETLWKLNGHCNYTLELYLSTCYLEIDQSCLSFKGSSVHSIF